MESELAALYGDPKRGGRVLALLDVGCGTGAMSARVQRWGKVVSMDYSSLALQYCRRRGLQHLAQGDAMKLPFQTSSFDTILCMDVLEHLPDDVTALCEFLRVLKPGGRMLATVPAYPHLWSEHDTALMHYRRYLRPELSSRLKGCGFRIEKLSHTMMLLYPIVALQRRLNARKPPHDPPQAAMPIFPAPINTALTSLVTIENIFAKRFSLPAGLTILAIARKQ